MVRNEERRHLPEKFVELPDEVKEFLADMREEEIENIKVFARMNKDEARILTRLTKLMAAAGTVGRFLGWVVSGAVAALVGLWGVIEVVGKIVSFKGFK